MQEVKDNPKATPVADNVIIPKKVSGLDLAYGGKMSDLLPKWEDIPDEFRHFNGTKWNKIVSDWFFSGLTNLKTHPKEGINENDALRHVGAILRSFDPSHEHKEAGCAYLLSLWFDEFNYQVAKRGGQ